MEDYVHKSSIVRTIWGKSDTILFIFAGAAAEFALNKAVDWLYFTNRLPSDPLGRLFSTVAYARAIVFSKKEVAIKAIDSMTMIHANVEAKRAAKIPDWAYRDVLYMLIDYSIRSFELLERRLTLAEKREVFRVFNGVGIQMGLVNLPESFEAFEMDRQLRLDQDLAVSKYTDDLFRQYRKHLGPIRYRMMTEAQTLIVPDRVKEMKNFRKVSVFKPVVAAYKMTRFLNMDWLLKELILPEKYKKQIRGLDVKSI